MECTMGNLGPYKCSAVGPGNLTVQLTASTPNGCRELFIDVRNQFYAAHNFDIRLRLPEPLSIDDCDVKLWGIIPLGDGSANRANYASSCGAVVIDADDGHVRNDWAAPFISITALAECPAGTSIYASSGPNNLPPICGLYFGGKNNGPCSSNCRGAQGNPIHVGSNNKYERTVDYLGQGVMPLNVIRHFNSFVFFRSTRLGEGWRFDFDRILRFITAPAGVQLASVAVERGNGRVYHYKLQAGAWAGDADINDRLTEQTDGSGVRTGWLYYDASEDVHEQYTPFRPAAMDQGSQQQPAQLRV